MLVWESVDKESWCEQRCWNRVVTIEVEDEDEVSRSSTRSLESKRKKKSKKREQEKNERANERATERHVSVGSEIKIATAVKSFNIEHPTFRRLIA